jgi:hypothetical protein
VATFALSASMTMAQEGTGGIMQKPNPNNPDSIPAPVRNFLQERRDDIREFREGRREDVKVLMEKGKEMRDEFKAMKASGTVSSTTRKEMRDEARDMKKEFMNERHEDKSNFMDDRKGDRKEFMDEMKDKMPKIMGFIKNATATAAIAARLGMSTTTLQAQLASGTKLKDIIKDKVTKEELRSFFPPKVKERIATDTSLLSKIFGQRKDMVTETIDENGEVKEEVKRGGGFFRRFFNF